MATTQQSLAAYRHILRAANLAFKGDARLLHGARTQARQSFEQGRGLRPGTDEFAAGVEHAESVALILRQNVVQAQTRAGGDADTWKLRIHDETERGDNETVKASGQRLKEKPAAGS